MEDHKVNRVKDSDVIQDKDAWFRRPFKRGHFGFLDDLVEQAYVAYMEQQWMRIIAYTVPNAIFFPVWHLLFSELDYGWGFQTACTFSAVGFLASLMAWVNHRYTDVASLRGFRFELCALASATFATLCMCVNTFDVDNSCMYTHLVRDTPNRTFVDAAQKESFRAQCVQLSPSDLAIIIMFNSQLGIRTKLTSVLLVIGFALTFLSLLFLHEVPVDSTTQIWMRVVVYIAVFLAAGISSQFFESASRMQFSLHGRVLQALEETRLATARIEMLLQSMLPASVIMRLSQGYDVIMDRNPEASVSFSDVVQFTNWSSSRSAPQVVAMVSALCRRFDEAARSVGVEKIKTIGDAYWAVAGLPDACVNHADRICAFMLEQLWLCEDENRIHGEWNGIRLRIGAHSGPVVGGVIGKKQISYEVFGHTNEYAEEMEQKAPNGACMCSDSCRSAIRDASQFSFVVQKLSNQEVAWVVTWADPDRGKWTSSDAKPLELHFDSSLLLNQLGLGDESPLVLAQESKEEKIERHHRQEREIDAYDLMIDEDERTCASCRMFDTHELEDRLRDFELHHFIPRLRISFLLTGALFLSFGIGMFIEGTQNAAAPATYIFLLSAVSCFIIVGLTYSGRPLPSVLLPHLILWMLEIVGPVASFNGLTPDGTIMRQAFTSVFSLVCIQFVALPTTLHPVWRMSRHVVPFIVAFFAANHLSLLEGAFWVVAGLPAITVVEHIIVRQARRRFIESEEADRLFVEAAHDKGRVRKIVSCAAPNHVLDDMIELMGKPREERTLAHDLTGVSVCFLRLDVADEHHTADEAWAEVSCNHAAMEQVLSRHPDVVKIKTVGANFVAATPLEPDATDEHRRLGAQALFAFAMDAMFGENRIGKRCGVACGPVTAAIFGTERMVYDIFGDTCNTASRCMTTAPPGTLQVTPQATAMAGLKSESLGDECEVASVFMKGKGDVSMMRFKGMSYPTYN